VRASTTPARLVCQVGLAPLTPPAYHNGMDIMVRIPDDLAQRLGTADELERRALEALVVEEYWLGHLTAPELCRVLGFEVGAALDGFLKAHNLAEPRAAEPAPPDDESRARARRAAANIIVRRKGVTLGGLDIKDLINEGRP
jgi:hypothetical protein